MLFYDIETNGLLRQMDRIHCLSILDSKTKNVDRYVGLSEIRKGVDRLAVADNICGHNVLDFDNSAIRMLFPNWEPQGRVWDTMVLSRLLWPDIKNFDFSLSNSGKHDLAGLKYGSHALEAWGIRLGLHKGDYKAEMEAKGLDPWAEYNESMGEYCDQDTRVTATLWTRCRKKYWSERAVQLEHDVAAIIFRQVHTGVCFNEKAAVDLYAEVAKQRDEAARRLKEIFGYWFVKDRTAKSVYRDEKNRKEYHRVFIPKRDNAKMGYVADRPLSKIKMVEFNPGSRDHIAHCLIYRHGWKPTKMTPGGKPQVDESTMEDLKYPEIPDIMRYLLLQKRAGQIAEGDKAWLKSIERGRIHGGMNPNGAVTGRGTHFEPNLGQVPASNAEFGHECRSLFIPRKGWVFVGGDASGLELRCLGHFMARYDGGEYVQVVLGGDIHWKTVQALFPDLAGVDRDKEDDYHNECRAIAKTFIYAFLYGAGNAKIGSIVGKGAKAGMDLRKRFLEGLPALGKLIEHVQEACSRGYLYGLDKRRIPIRSAHSALNTLLQSAGGLIMKEAMVITHRLAAERGLVIGRDFEQVLWVHDEFQFEARTAEIAHTLGQCIVDAVRMAGESFNFKCPLDGEYMVGGSWAETH